MIALLGASGYVGQTFQAELEKRNLKYIPVSRKDTDYYDLFKLKEFIKNNSIKFLINAAGFTGKPNVDQCEVKKRDTIMGNVMLPKIISLACLSEKINWGHVSSGCLYNGDNGGGGFTEDDEPNFSFDSESYSFYSGSKALAEKILKEDPTCYIWRLRMPFDNINGPRNYLSKLIKYEKTYHDTNSMSHRSHFVKYCMDLYELNAPFGIYNITNDGYISTREIVQMMKEILNLEKEFIFFEDGKEFLKSIKAPRSNCILDVSKLKSTGVSVMHCRDAIEEALRSWRNE